MGNLSKDSKISPLFHSLTPSARPGRAHVAGLHRLFKGTAWVAKGLEKAGEKAAATEAPKAAEERRALLLPELMGELLRLTEALKTDAFAHFFLLPGSSVPSSCAAPDSCSR